MNEILKSTIGQGYSDELREKVWNQLVQTSPKPSILTKKRIEKIKLKLWNNCNFWWDIIDRHGLRNSNLQDLDSDLKEHVVGNFWGQLCQCHVMGKNRG